MPDIDDKELFESATATDEVAPEAEATVETTAATDDTTPRDEKGRFAARQAEPEPTPAPEAAPQAQQQARDEAHIPSWRLREEREAREAAERRAADIEARWQRQFAELQARLPKAEPQAAPDVFENPNAFLQHGVSQAVDPIKSELQQQREYFSRMMAEQAHGAEKVKAAYDWIAQGMAQRDPEAVATYQRAMQSMHPFGDLVTAHQQRSVYQQIGNDPQAWFGKTLDERISSDPKFAGELLQKLQQSARQQNPQGKTAINLPPSLRSVPSAQVSDDSGNSDADIFRYAIAR